jgi:ribosome maturation factor RimP
MSQPKQKAEQVRALVEAVIAREGFELLDVEFVVEQGRPILRMYVDTIPPGTKERGVSVEDCSNISRTVGDLLDVEDVMDGEYHLEVSSPGLFRPLTKPEHFDRALGERIKLKTYEKLEGRKVFTGVLTKREGGTVTIAIDGTEYAVELAKVAKANLEPLL